MAQRQFSQEGNCVELSIASYFPHIEFSTGLCPSKFPRGVEKNALKRHMQG